MFERLVTFSLKSRGAALLLLAGAIAVASYLEHFLTRDARAGHEATALLKTAFNRLKAACGFAEAARPLSRGETRGTPRGE
jgi:hypothetical protein